MRPSLAVAVLAILSVLPISLLAQQSTQPVAASARDPQAVAVLAQSVNAMGGQQVLSQLSDLTVTGQFTNELASPPDVKATRTYVKGLDRVRMETDTSDGTEAVVLARGQGFQTAQGRKEWLRTHNTIGRGLEAFPLLCLAELLTSQQSSVTIGPATTMDGRQVVQIQIRRAVVLRSVKSDNLSNASRVEIFIDPQTLLPVRLRYYVHPEIDSRIEWPMDVLYSDYRPANGAMMPHTVTQVMSGRTIGQFNFQTYTFNSGLSDSLFK